MAARKILVSGATGKQGGAVVKALLESPPPFPHEILALTRNTSSKSAKALADKPNVSLLQGDLNDCPAIFEKAGGKGSIWGVFSVQLPAFGGKGPKDQEEQQGNALTDAAVENGVSHFVYSGVDRGGANSDNTPTEIPHFIAKHIVERHLKEKATGTDMSWTILRPVAFFENMTPDMLGRGFGAMWMNMGNTKLQLVATKDIGVFAAMAFADPGKFKNKAITLAGDELTYAEGSDVFYKVHGRALPRSYGFVGNFFQWMIPELGIMFKWFVDAGYGADIAECKSLNPKMLDFEAWLREESKFTG